MPIKVLLADHPDFIRRAIRSLLKANPEIEVVGEAANFAETIQMSKVLKPEIIVMDLRMPDDEETNQLAESFGAVALIDKMDLSHKLLPTMAKLASPNTVAAE